MAANTIAYAQIFQQVLDEQMLQELTTGFMEANASMVQYNGGNTVRLPKVSMTGLGDYSRSTGYPTSGSVTLEWETHTFDKDRGQSFSLDAMDVDESNFVATASMTMSEFQRTKVVPEVDAYRYSKIFSLANTALKTGAYTPVVGTIFGQLKNDIAAIQDIVGEAEPLVIAMSYSAANILDQADDIEHNLEMMDFAAGTMFSKVKSLDGIPIVRVPSARFKSAFTFSATDGFTAASNAMALNWVIMARRSVIAVVKQDLPRVFDPATNQAGNAWKIDYRKYHTLWIPDNKLSGVYVSYLETAAPALSITVAVGSATGTTKFTATAGSGNTLAYKLTAAAVTGYLNTIPTGTTAYTSGDDISATAGQFLAAYEVDAAGRIVKYTSYELQAADIKS